MNTFEKMKNALESEECNELMRNLNSGGFRGICKHFNFDPDTEEITDKQFFELLNIYERNANVIYEEHIKGICTLKY